jgi:hypothetical protein
VHIEHVQYDLMDYITNRLNDEERNLVEQHLNKCTRCKNQYIELLPTGQALKQNHHAAPGSEYYSTILPRIRERLIAQKRPMWYYNHDVKIILPLTVSIILAILFIRIPIEYLSKSSQTEGLQQIVIDLDADEVMQAVEKEYANVALSPNQDVAAIGVAEHLQGDRFLKSAVTKQIENEEIAEMDVEGMISDLDGEQVNQVLSGLSERNVR